MQETTQLQAHNQHLKLKLSLQLDQVITLFFWSVQGGKHVHWHKRMAPWKLINMIAVTSINIHGSNYR